MGDKDKMKKTFQKLLTVSLGFDDEDKYTLTGVGKKCGLLNVLPLIILLLLVKSRIYTCEVVSVQIIMSSGSNVELLALSP